MALHQRLLRDIAEVQKDPYPNIQLIPDEANVTLACLLLTVDGGRKLHLSIKFPSEYPLAPPKISIQSDVWHPNVYGSYLCSSILNTKEDYTPAYTLQGICIQMLSFFLSDHLESVSGGFSDLRQYKDDGFNVSDYMFSECRKCESQFYQIHHKGSSHRPYQTVPGQDGPSTVKRRRRKPVKKSFESMPRVSRKTLQELPDEITLLICEKLASKDLMSLAQACSWIGGETGIINKYNIIRKRETICFCFKKGITDSKLGIGVVVDFHGKKGTLSSEFDIISYEAFHEFDHKQSVHGKKFDFWMPLALSQYHFSRIEDDIRPKLQLIGDTARLDKTTATEVLCAFMNDVVVRLNDHAGQYGSWSTLTHASEKAIESYYHLLHLLLCCATKTSATVQNINRAISNFLKGKTSKSDIPNLGQLLIKILISDVPMSDELLMAIIRETVTRNVVWMLDRKGAGMVELAYMETDAISTYRLQKTFEAGRTSYRLLMFLNLFRKSMNRGDKTLMQLRDELFDSYGSPPLGTSERLAKQVREIQQVDNFPSFIRIMGLQPPSARQFTQFLRERVEDSMNKGYSVWGIHQSTALDLRQAVEPGVGVRQEYNPNWRLDDSRRGNEYGGFFPNRGRR